MRGSNVDIGAETGYVLIFIDEGFGVALIYGRIGRLL
jgi:hypothetical protein